MKANEFITEVFERPVAWSEWTGYSESPFAYSFIIDDHGYKVHFNNETVFRTDGFEIGFSLVKLGPDSKINPNDPGATNLSNTGNEFKVFATVLDIIKAFIKTHHPEMLTFSAKEPSRKRLYRSMVKLLKQEGFSTYYTNDADDDPEEEYYYAFSDKRALAQKNGVTHI
jgi:hypothetical protein